MRGIRPLRSSWNRHGWGRDALTNATSFIGSEEESPILDYRAAEGASELVLIKLRLVAGNALYSREAISVSVKSFIPEKLIYIAVKSIGPGLGHNVDHGTRVAAIFGIEGVGQHTKFSDTVRRWLHGWQIHKLIVGIAPVDTEIVRTATSAVHRHRPCS